MTQFSNTQIADVLEQAAEHVRAGWTQRRVAEYVDGQRYVCGSGAVWLAAGMCIIPAVEIQDPVFTTTTILTMSGTGTHETRERDNRRRLWSQTLDKLRDYVGECVPSWNDSIGQTQDRVADTMLRLAKELRNNETS